MNALLFQWFLGATGKPPQRQGACQGVEYSLGRCEIWTRSEGIYIAKEIDGFTCCWDMQGLAAASGVLQQVPL